MESRRHRLAKRGRQWWASLTAEQRASWMAANAEGQRRAKATMAERYPHRAAQYADFRQALESGTLVREPCPDCGGAGRAELLFDDEHDEPGAWRVTGWRCYACRRAVVDG